MLNGIFYKNLLLIRDYKLRNLFTAISSNWLCCDDVDCFFQLQTQWSIVDLRNLARARMLQLLPSDVGGYV